MPAEAGEQIGHGLESVQKVKHRNAAARSLRLAFLVAQHEHRAAESLHQPAGDDTHYSAMPVLPDEDQRGLVVRHRRPLALLENALHEFRLGLLALLIESVQ